VNQTESRYLEVAATGRKVLKKALRKYGEDTRLLTGNPLLYCHLTIIKSASNFYIAL